MKKFLVLLEIILLAGGVWLVWKNRPVDVDMACQYIEQNFKVAYSIGYNSEVTHSEEQRKPDSIHQPEYLAENYADEAAFTKWYKKLSEDDKNTVLATTVAACRPELTKIALANGGDINTRITTYKIDGDHYIFARLRPEDDKDNYDKVLAEAGKRPIDCDCGGPWTMNYGYNNSLISYGIVSCGHKQADKSVDMMETLVKYGADTNKTVAVKNPEISDGIDGIYLINSNESYAEDDSGHSMITDSPLAVAVHTYNPAAVKYLLEKRVDANEGIAAVLEDIYETENDIKEEIKPIREAQWSSDCKRYKKLKETKEIYIQILDMLLANLKNKEISAETASAIYLYQNYYLHDDKDVVTKLKKLEVKPDYNSATMKAAMSDYKTNFGKVVRDLVEHGTDINSVDEWGNTALHSATDEGDAEAVEFLLEHGADVNKQSEYGSTALMEILRWNSWEKDAKNRIKIVKMLLKYGADTNIQTESGRTALHMAMANQDGYEEEITELLLEHGAKVNIRDKDGVTPLFEACESSKSYGIVKSLLKHGADVNVKDKKGETPLFYAYSLNNIKSLLNYGTDVNARDTEGRTALFGILRRFAEFEQRKKVINLFVEKGYDINARDNEDHTLLMEMLYNFSNSDGYLSGNEDRKTAGYLAELGVDVNAQDKSGKTTLFYVVAKNDPQSVALLLKLGADPSIADNEGKKAFDYCRDSICSMSPYNSDKFRAETVAKFNQEQSKYQTLWDDESINSENEELMQLSEVLTAAIDGGNCEVIKAYVDKGGSLYAYLNLYENISRSNLALLHKMISKGQVQCLREILQMQNINLNQIMLYKSGYHDSAITPLQVAINSGNEEMVKLLRSYGAKDVSGQTLEKLERLQRIMTEMEDTIAEGWAQIDSHFVDGSYVGDVEVMESIQKKLCRIREEVLKLAKSADLTDWEKRVYEVNSDNVNHQVMYEDCGLNIRGKVSDLIPDS